MKAKELRIGNLVNAFGEGRIYIVKGYSPVDIWEQSFHEDTICIESTEPDKYIGCSTAIDSISGIPITEEWLIKFGFETHGNGEWNIEPLLCFYIWKDKLEGWSVSPNSEWPGNCRTKVNYVHQLQNLYFALTDEELTLK